MILTRPRRAVLWSAGAALIAPTAGPAAACEAAMADVGRIVREGLA